MLFAAAALLSRRTTLAFAPIQSRAYSRTTASFMANPKVFFDMAVGDKDVGRIEFELRADVVPKVKSNTSIFKVIVAGVQLQLPDTTNQSSFFLTFHFDPAMDRLPKTFVPCVPVSSSQKIYRWISNF